MEKHLKVTPLVLQVPLGQAKDFRGVIDLVTMEMMFWEPGSDGDQFSTIPLLAAEEFSQLPSLKHDLPVDHSLVMKAVDLRSQLADKVG